MDKELIAAHLKLTNAESASVLQVYEQYSGETSTINATKTAILKEYSQKYNALTDNQADDLVRRWIETDVQQAKLSQQFAEIVRKVLPEKKAATLLRLERRNSMTMDAQLTSGLPPAESEVWTHLVELSDVRRRETNLADPLRVDDHE
jgi:hypothetical protein